MSEHDSTCALPALPNVTGVQFRHIAGFPGYCVSDDGTIWSKRHYNGKPSSNWRQMLVRLGTSGYPRVMLYRNAKSAGYFVVHTIVLESFVGPRPHRMQACHRDGCRTNNSLTNLRWDTPSNNELDKRLNGNDNSGERHGNHKLTTSQVLEIRDRAASGEASRAIAPDYGVSARSIRKVVARYLWRHI